MTLYATAHRPAGYRPRHRRIGALVRNAGLTACVAIWLGGTVLGAALVTF